MNTVVSIEPRIIHFKMNSDTISAHLEDGRLISVPLAWSWRLLEATQDQRNRFEILCNGLGVHWHEIDKDISAQGMLYGAPARRSS